MSATTKLRSRDLARIAARTPLLQATWNYERQQGVGWACCLEPALERLYPEGPQRTARLAQSVAYFNTQPTMASFALGAVAALEESRAASGDSFAGNGEIARVKAVLGTTLAALGDTLFWLTLRPLAASIGVLVALRFQGWGAALMLVLYNSVHLYVRVRGVWIGYELGPAVLSPSLRDRLQGFSATLAALGAATCGLLMAALLAPAGGLRPLPFQAALIAGFTMGLLTATRPRPSPTQWAVVAGLACIGVSWR